MARDAVTITDLAPNAGATQPAGTAITPGNGAVIAGAAGRADDILIRVTNTNGTQRTVTFKAGAKPPALRAGLGDLAVIVPATTGDKLVVLESARFAQADGSVQVDFEASMAGIISAVRMPKGS